MSGAAVSTAEQARQLWLVYEPVHAVTYFAPETRAAGEGLGLRGFWRTYFAMRSAPLGPVPAEVVAALFFGFSAPMVARALPAVWEVTSPEQAWAARVDAAGQALARVLGGVDEGLVDELADTAELAVSACGLAGRGLFAAHLHLPTPTTPLLRLWQAVTLLREHRGDGHVAAATGAGLDGLELLVLADAVGSIGRADTQPNRGWSDEEWADASRRLADRGLLDGADGVAATGRVTDAGRALHHQVEAVTDALSSRPWATVGAERTARFLRAMTPLARQVGEGTVPYPNAMGVPRP